MKLLILGGSGLIGHKLWQILSVRFGDVYTTIRKSKDSLQKFEIFDSNKVIENVDVIDFSSVENILNDLSPDVILNCIGITKRRPEINEPIKALKINSIFPHELSKWCAKNNRKMIHFSTDCVFNGKEGNYTEDSLTTAEDNYGRTKAFGEVKNDPNALTIRSSFIGRELSHGSELLEWFLSQNGKVIKGFQKAFYSGVSTIEMSKVVGDIIEYHPDLTGLYQLTTDSPISKFELLNIAKDSFNMNIEIVPDSDFYNNNTLNGKKLKQVIEYTAPSWQTMLDELANESIIQYKDF